MIRDRRRMGLQRLEVSHLAFPLRDLGKVSFNDLWMHTLASMVSYGLSYSPKKLELEMFHISTVVFQE